jgi:hypothetical protein
LNAAKGARHSGADPEMREVFMPTFMCFAAPPNPNIRQNTRFAPAERTPVTISGILVLIKQETDQDYHLYHIPLIRTDAPSRAGRWT